jgi:hypothetical protein
MLGIAPIAGGGATVSFVQLFPDRMKFRRDSIDVSMGFTEFPRFCFGVFPLAIKSRLESKQDCPFG